ncbi:MAG: transposase [Gemmataceae bacterium]
MRVGGHHDGDRSQGLPGSSARWVVERTFAWLVLYRRLVKDYERHTETSEAMIHAAMIHLTPRRLPPLS